MVTAPTRARLRSVDLLRGIVMLLMALDHTRDYFSPTPFDALDLAHTNAGWFLTRWITHYCAPVFIFLAGTGAFLARRPTSEQARFLLTRGLWIVLLELTVVHLGWEFELSYHFVLLQVMWAIGWSMVALAALVYLPSRLVAAIGVAMIASHNLLDNVHLDSWWWAVLHEHRRWEPWPGHKVMLGYPLVPWIGVMAAGYGFGEILERPDRRRVLVLLGGTLTALFLVVRGFNHYGNARAWEHTGDTVKTVLSFLDCQKYPPSLDYLLMTLGPAILALAALERVAWKPIEIYGRVPMFYYVLHIFLIHAGSTVYRSIQAGRFTVFGAFGQPHDYGIGLAGCYVAWILVVVALYPACRWYAALKARRRDLTWLTYL